MKHYISILAVAALALGGCTSAQDVAVSTKINSVVTTINADVAIAKAQIVAAVQAACPIEVQASGSIAVVTALVTSLLGLPATGTVVIGLETSVTKICTALTVKTVTTSPAPPPAS